MKHVYLSGPITGLTYEGCTDWRDYASRRLREFGIIGLSPMRAKEFLRGTGAIDGNDQIEETMATDSAITTRDRWDTQRSDMILVNLIGATRVSVGTMIELGWADAARVPIVLVMEDLDNMHEHPIVRALGGYRVATLDEGLDIIGAALGDPPEPVRYQLAGPLNLSPGGVQPVIDFTQVRWNEPPHLREGWDIAHEEGTREVAA